MAGDINALYLIPRCRRGQRSKGDQTITIITTGDDDNSKVASRAQKVCRVSVGLTVIFISRGGPLMSKLGGLGDRKIVAAGSGQGATVSTGV